jgi:hypothetical protein
MSPQPKGTVPPELAKRLRLTAAVLADAKAMRDEAIVDALKAGGSMREVANLVGISQATVGSIGHKGGWPTEEQRAAWQSAKDQRIRFDATPEEIAAGLKELADRRRERER